LNQKQNQIRHKNARIKPNATIYKCTIVENKKPEYQFRLCA